MTQDERIDRFFETGPWAVVGASQDRAKYGNKVLRAYQQNNRAVYPINPKADKVEGIRAYPNLESLPEAVAGVSVITPPKVTEKVVSEAARLSVKNIWLQPGAESDMAVERAESSGMNVIAGGPCIPVSLKYRESW
jgi:predicted CoA-binding protein